MVTLDKRIWRLGAYAVMVVSLAACATAPTQEMSDARQAVNAARSADAQVNAPDALRTAQEHLDEAARALQSGRYDGAKDEALAARRSAISARRIAVAIGEASAAVGAARSRGAGGVDEAEALLGKARDAARRLDEEQALRSAGQAATLAAALR